MKFRIKRASEDEYYRPAKYAYSELSDWVQVVNFPTIEEHDKKYKSFRSEGTNHKVIGNGTIERTFPDYKELWYIDINSLEELIAFQKENKKIVIMDDYYNHYIPLIIIYDDWLE